MTSDSVGLSNPVWKCVSNECEGLNVGLSHNSKRRDGVMERSVCADSPVSTVSTHHKNGPGL